VIEAVPTAGQDMPRWMETAGRAMGEATTENRLPLRRIACGRCGSAFDCGGRADGTCWCMDEAYRLPMPAAAQQDCLCPACLRAVALSRANGHSP
jgi:hypothetical protein